MSVTPDVHSTGADQKSDGKKAAFGGQTGPRKPSTVQNTIRARDGGKLTLKYGKTLAIKLHCTECLK